MVDNTSAFLQARFGPDSTYISLDIISDLAQRFRVSPTLAEQEWKLKAWLDSLRFFLPADGGERTMHLFLLYAGFASSKAYPCVYTTSKGGSISTASFLYVDDIYFCLTRFDEPVVVPPQVFEQLNEGLARDRRSRRCRFLLGIGIEVI